MNRTKTLVVGLTIVAALLAALLATDEIGVGRRDDGTPRYPYVLEDQYDRLAYQQRGRWQPSGGRPYLDEFAEYPQLSTWIMGLPYLTFDHGVPPAEASSRARPFRRPTSYASEGRLEARLRAAGATQAEVEAFLDAAWRAGRDAALERAPPGPLLAGLEPDVRRAIGDRDVDRAEIAADVQELCERVRAREVELRGNRVAYGDRHHVLMAILFATLLCLATANLKRLGRSPGWALLLCLPASLYFGFNRYDLVVTNLVAAAFLFQFRERRRLAAVALGLAIMAKWYPLVLVPLFLAQSVWRDRERGLPWRAALARGALVPGLIVVAVVGVFLGITFAWGGGGLEAVLALPRWHLYDRHPNHASLLAQITNPARWGWFRLDQRDQVERVFKILQLAPSLLLALVPLRSHRALVVASLVATLAMILFSEFFSPQWILWVTALAIYIAPSLRRFFVLCVALELVMYLQLPIIYFEVMASKANTSDYFTAPAFANFRTITDVRLGLVALFLAVAAASLPRLLARSSGDGPHSQPGSPPGASPRVS